MKLMSLKERAHAYLKEKLLNCEYMPGEFIDEKHLSGVLNISRTPIREAILLLEQEGLLKILPKRGIQVCDITAKAISEAYEVRKMVESYCIRNWGYLLCRDTLGEYQRIFEDQDSMSHADYANQMDVNFHRFIISHKPNRYIETLLGEINDQIYRARILASRDGEKIQHTSKEHLSIIAALLDASPVEAEAMLLAHLEQGRLRTIQRMM